MIQKIIIKNKIVYFIFISCFILFGRSFSGLEVLNFRIGEWVTALCFLLSFIFMFSRFERYEKYFIGKGIHLIHKFIIISFFLELVLNFPINRSTYIFKSSSYIWIIVSLYVGNFIFSKINYESGFFNLFFAFLPIIYIFQTTFYPEFIQNFFIDFSDKFEFLKAGDVLLVFVLSLLILQNSLSNSLNYITIFLFSFSIFLPYFLYASKGAFLAAIVFFLLQLNSIKIVFTKFSIKKFFILLSSVFLFFSSTFYIYGNFIFEKVPGESNELVISLDVVDSLTAIAEERNTTEALFSFYIDNGRLYSQDVTANWRLQIWQDIIEDLSESKNILFGYGYNEIIPAMDDKERRGSDGKNENVHNYFFNILARGGLFQLLLVCFFHCYIVFHHARKFKNYKILKYMIPIFVVSFFDTSMESVRFPFIYYSFLGYFFNEDSIYLQ